MGRSKVNEFVSALQRSKLLTNNSALAAAMRTGDRVTDPETLAVQLVVTGQITAWQAARLVAGQTEFHVGRCLLLDSLGQGNMGEVFKARQAPLNRVVAVKKIAASRFRSANAVSRFKREILLAAEMNHPNVVLAFDADFVSGQYYLVMEYFPGRNMHQWMRSNGPPPAEWASECIRQAASGLQHAHECGLVHRDIKPANLMIKAADFSERPHLKILDLGLGRFVAKDAENTGATMAGKTVGTYEYLAPERLTGSGEPDIRSDVYALGCSFFEFLTRRLPFENTVAGLQAKTREPAPAVREFRSDVPPAVESVIARMLDREPDRRYQTPIEVAHALAPLTGSC